MKLYASNIDNKFLKIFEIDKENENQKIFYMIENSELINSMINKIKKIQNINLIKKNKKNTIHNFKSLKKKYE